MGKQDLRERQQEALRLEQVEGLTAPQVAKKLGISTSTARRWLRAARGEPKKLGVRDDVLRLLDEGHDAGEVARILGVTLAHVERYERERRGPRPWISSKARVPLWLQAPDLYAKERWVRAEAFGWNLLRECTAQTFRDPVGAKHTVGLTIRHFTKLRRLRREGSRAHKVTTCQLVQALGIRAGRERALDRFESALTILSEARALAADCEPCRADLQRREAVVFVSLSKLSEAMAKISSAEKYYIMDPVGHDLYGLGGPSCALVKAQILIDSGQTADAIPVCENAIEMTPAETEDLYVALWYSLAEALFARREDNDLSRARSICRQHLLSLGEEPDERRARLLWLDAKLSEADGDIDAAVSALEDAFADVQYLKIAPGMVAIAADIERLLPDSRRFINRLEEFEEWDDELGQKTLPKWLHHLRDLIERSSRMAISDVIGAIDMFRAEGHGSVFMPQLNLI